MVEDRDGIARTAEAIGAYVRRTPSMTIGGGAVADVPVVAKLEQLQVTGTFKARGAFATLLASEADEVAIASGGNAGAAYAYAAQRLGRRAVVYVSTSSPTAKVERIRNDGAEVRIVEGEYADAARACAEYLEGADVLAGHAYDRPEMLLGAGTLAMELEEDTELDSVLVAVGGGGLIGGVAAWYRDRIKVVAVETEGTPTLDRALAAGRPVDVEVSGSAVSALGAARIGEHAWALRDFVADNVLVSDEQVAEAQRTLWNELRLVTEPAGAVALAALRSGRYRPAPGERVGIVVCGANTDPGSVV